MSVVVGFALSIIAILPIALSGVMYLFKIPVAVKTEMHALFGV